VALHPEHRDSWRRLWLFAEDYLNNQYKTFIERGDMLVKLGPMMVDLSQVRADGRRASRASALG